VFVLRVVIEPVDVIGRTRDVEFANRSSKCHLPPHSSASHTVMLPRGREALFCSSLTATAVTPDYPRRTLFQFKAERCVARPQSASHSRKNNLRHVPAVMLAVACKKIFVATV